MTFITMLVAQYVAHLVALMVQHGAQLVALMVQHEAQLVANGGVKLRFVVHLFRFLLCYKVL